MKQKIHVGGNASMACPKWLKILLWVLLLANMAVIFALSSKTAEQSTPRPGETGR